MFGYVLPERSELKIRELETYQSYYCGLCFALKEQYRFWGRLSLNYDMTFLAILLTALYEPEEMQKKVRCIVHPARKHMSVQNKYIKYAADMNILLTYYKCLDDWQDERKVVSAAYARLLYRAGKKVGGKYPQKADCIQRYLEELSVLEKQECADLDVVAGCFGNICAELFVCEEDIWKSSLRKIGFFLGKFIYLLDAYDDLEKDLKNGCYNPLRIYTKRENFTEWIHQILRLNIAEVCREFEKLPIVEHAGLLKNILYAGVWSKFNTVCDGRKCVRTEKKDDRSI